MRSCGSYFYLCKISLSCMPSTKLCTCTVSSKLLSSLPNFCTLLQLHRVNRLTPRLSLVEQELLIFSEHLSSPPVFSEVRVTRSLVLYICFVDHCLSFCPFSFSHCVVCSSLILRILITPLVSLNPS